MISNLSRNFRGVHHCLFLSAVLLSSATPVRSLAADFDPSPNGSVYAIAVQSDEKILVGGDFTSLCSQTRSFVGRLNSDGSLDIGFKASASGTVRVLALQADNQILVGGLFTNLCGAKRMNLGRLNDDGTLDAAYQVSAEGEVRALAVQPDGKVIVGGCFDSLCGEARNNIGRLNPDGTLDPSFTAESSGPIFALSLQPDGKCLIGGGFTNVCGQPRSNLARLNPNGTLDLAFDGAADNVVRALVVRPDGKILAGGDFTYLCGQWRERIGCLDTNGSLDSIYVAGANGPVHALALQTDGIVLVGGTFTTLAGGSCRGLAKMDSTGTLQPNFALEHSGGSVLAVVLPPRDCPLAGGSFTAIAGESHNNLAEVCIGGLSGAFFDYTASTATWQRTGASPEIWWLQGKYTTNGVDWWPTPPGTRTSGVWRVTVPRYSMSNTLFLRGYVSGANGFADESVGPPAILKQPRGATNGTGQTASFTVWTAGSPLLVYQWSKDGSVLSNTSRINGAQTASLTISNLSAEDRGEYSVRISNSYGNRTSVAANLQVISPIRLAAEDGNLGFRSNQFGFKLAPSDNLGQNLVIEGSTNMCDWVPLQTNLLQTEPLLFNDPASTHLPLRFYRSRLQ